MHGVDREEVLDPDWEPLQRQQSAQSLHPAIEEVAAGSFRHRSPPVIAGSGYVVRSLEAALWPFTTLAIFGKRFSKRSTWATTPTRRVRSAVN
jgi:ADP-ribosyl-[dinitrogen reductase] hydrolase